MPYCPFTRINRMHVHTEPMCMQLRKYNSRGLLNYAEKFIFLSNTFLQHIALSSGENKAVIKFHAPCRILITCPSLWSVDANIPVCGIYFIHIQYDNFHGGYQTEEFTICLNIQQFGLVP